MRMYQLHIKHTNIIYRCCFCFSLMKKVSLNIFFEFNKKNVLLLDFSGANQLPPQVPCGEK